ncbi:MAG: hypothetical protein ACLFTI_05935 [Anaerolineales bacterium]
MSEQTLTSQAKKLPSKQELYRFLAVWLAFVNTWAFLSWLYEVPSLIRRLNLWDLVGSLAYTTTFALVESLGIFIPFTLLALLIPTRWLRYVTFALHALIIAMMVLYVGIGFTLDSGQQTLTWVLGFVSLTGLAYILRRKPRIQQRLVGLLDRLVVLATLYLIVDVVGVVIVVIRNVF